MCSRLTAVIAGLVLAATFGAVPAAADHEPEYDRKSDEWTLVEHIQFPQGTDLFFQRREGRQMLDGEVIDDTRDYLVAGNDASGAVGDPPEGEPLGLNIYDVTDPTAPVELAAIDCPGYHADVAIYENYALQAIDSASTNTGCAEEWDPNGLDETEAAGVRIFDMSDPANPVVAGFVTSNELQSSPHNFTVVPWAGLLYIAGSDFTRTDPQFAIVDLEDPEFPATVIPMNDISSTATAECHDIGVAQLEEQDLAFCAAVSQTFIWDITDPTDPQHVSVVPLAIESIHHGARLAPDGTTLVLNDELGGAAFAPGCAPTTQDPLGALWFYDISDPSSPQLQGTFSTSEAAFKLPCTSHFYNFIPGTSLLTVSWYQSGMMVVDYGDLPETTEHAVFTPDLGSFWASYYWRGYIYGSSFAGPTYGGDIEDAGVWITQLEGVGDVEPSPHDRGTVWAPWSPPEPEPEPEVTETVAEDTRAMPTTGGGVTAALAGLALLGLALVGLRRVRG